MPNLNDDLRRPQLQLADDKPISQQSRQKNDHAQLKTRNIRAIALDQKSHRQRRDDSGKIAGKIFRAGPYADSFEWSAALQDHQQIAGSQSDQRGPDQAPDRDRSSRG